MTEMGGLGMADEVEQFVLNDPDTLRVFQSLVHGVGILQKFFSLLKILFL